MSGRAGSQTKRTWLQTRHHVLRKQGERDIGAISADGREDFTMYLPDNLCRESLLLLVKCFSPNSEPTVLSLVHQCSVQEAAPPLSVKTRALCKAQGSRWFKRTSSKPLDASSSRGTKIN